MLLNPIRIEFPAQPGAEPPARTLASAIVTQLRADIVTCRIAPGEKLNISTISKRFNVSLAAVREALSRLMAAGLVVAEDQRGFRASPLSIPDLMDLTQTRIEIETLALRRSMANGGEGWRESVTLAWRSLQAIPRTLAHDRGQHNEAWTVMHGQFHATLVSACGLAWLMRFGTRFTNRVNDIGAWPSPSNRPAATLMANIARLWRRCSRAMPARRQPKWRNTLSAPPPPLPRCIANSANGQAAVAKARCCTVALSTDE